MNETIEIIIKKNQEITPLQTKEKKPLKPSKIPLEKLTINDKLEKTDKTINKTNVQISQLDEDNHENDGSSLFLNIKNNSDLTYSCSMSQEVFDEKEEICPLSFVKPHELERPEEAFLKKEEEESGSDKENFDTSNFLKKNVKEGLECCEKKKTKKIRKEDLMKMILQMNEVC